MHGQESVIAMRRNRAKPEAVWFHVGPEGCDAGASRDWAHYGLDPHVLVRESESIRLLDLRFVVGLLVMVNGTDRAKCEEMHQACIKAGARRVVTHVAAIDRNGDASTVVMMVFHEPGREFMAESNEEFAA